MPGSRANGNPPGSITNGDAPNSVVIPPNSMFFPNMKMEGHGMVDVGTRSSKIVSMNSRHVEQLVRILSLLLTIIPDLHSTRSSNQRERASQKG
jgi:hypothetical protein